MALPTSGAISFQDINNELGVPSTARLEMGGDLTRAFIGSGYTSNAGNSVVVPFWIANRNDNVWTSTTQTFSSTQYCYNQSYSSSNLHYTINDYNNSAWPSSPRTAWYTQGGYPGYAQYSRVKSYPPQKAIQMGDLRNTTGRNGGGSAATYGYTNRISPVWRSPNVLENYDGSQATHGNGGNSAYDLKCGAVFDAIQCSYTGNAGDTVSSGSSQQTWNCNELIASNHGSLQCCEDNGALYGSNYYYRGVNRGVWQSTSGLAHPTLQSYTRPQGQGGTSWALKCRPEQNLRLQYQKHGYGFVINNGFVSSGNNDQYSLPFYNTPSSVGTAQAQGVNNNRMSQAITSSDNPHNQNGWTCAIAYKLDSNRGTSMGNTSSPWTRNWIIWGSGYYEWAALANYARADNNYSTAYIGSMRGSSNYGTRGSLNSFPSGFSGYPSIDDVWIVDVIRCKGDQWSSSAFNSSTYNGGSMVVSSWQIMKSNSSASNNIYTASSVYTWGNNGSTQSRISDGGTTSQYYWGPTILPGYWNEFTTSNQCYHLFHWSFYCTPFSDSQMEHLAKNLWYHYVGGTP